MRLICDSKWVSAASEENAIDGALLGIEAPSCVPLSIARAQPRPLCFVPREAITRRSIAPKLIGNAAFIVLHSWVVLEETWVAEMGIPTIPLKGEWPAAGRKALCLLKFQWGLPGTVQDGRRCGSRTI
jgi:hypothetical protein